MTRHNIRANVLWETHGVATVDIDHRKTDSNKMTLPPYFLAAHAPTICINNTNEVHDEAPDIEFGSNYVFSYLTT